MWDRAVIDELLCPTCKRRVKVRTSRIVEHFTMEPVRAFDAVGIRVGCSVETRCLASGARVIAHVMTAERPTGGK